MIPFTELTPRGQVRRLRVLARSALAAYDLRDANFRLLQHGENTTFRVENPGYRKPESGQLNLYHPGRFLLRVHRSGYQNEAQIASELMWLAALREAGVPVPEPLHTPTGKRYTKASAPGVPAPRICSLLRWMRGQFYENNPQPRHIAAVGRLMAHLHNHTAAWHPPATFTRRRWDIAGLFGDNSGFHLPEAQLWAQLPATYAVQFRAVVEQTAAVMGTLDLEPGAMGLIHADLHLGNVLFGLNAEGCLEARSIDFDDCGIAHWVYDFAVILGDYITGDEYERFHDALLAGYAEVRPLPLTQLAHLNTFIAARLVSLMLWATDMAQVNKGFLSGLPRWYAWASEGIKKSAKL